LTAQPAAKLPKPLRSFARLRWDPSALGRTWQQFAATGSWQAMWDAATGVPRRIWGSGIAAPGSIASAATAERYARNVLRSHLELLAPGSSPSDFTLVSNSRNGDIRAVGFAQTSDGYPVLGGQVSFLFKRDRLFVIGSEALPHVPQLRAASALTLPVARTQMAASLRTAVSLPNAPVVAEAEVVVLPLIGEGSVLGYRLVAPLTIDGGAHGRFTGYMDLSTGQVVAVQQRNMYADGTVRYRGVDRYPGKGRTDVAASRAKVLIDGVPTTTSPLGAVSWGAAATVSVQTSVEGDLVKVINKADGVAASAQFSLAPGGALLWDASGNIDDDAQVAAYVDVNLAKEYVRTHFDPDLAALNDQLVVNVNLDQGCNAFFDGTALNFFRRTERCENTALVQDVVFHEFGHRLHAAEIVRGVGAFDPAMSEGAADFLAATITGDSGMGRGFNFTEAPLRDLDPPGSESIWPRDVGEIHRTGLIFGGTFWDLRKDLIASLGDTAGRALVNKLFIAALRYAIDIPSSLVAVLAADDDDGNLANGTPHEAAIRLAFGNHGLRAISGRITAPGRVDGSSPSTAIMVEVDGAPNSVASDRPVGATLSWQASPSGKLSGGSVEALRSGPNRFSAVLPLPLYEPVRFNVTVRFEAGLPLTLADNAADPDYQVYAGPTETLYCTDFENADPFASGWTTGTETQQPSQWQWGTPTSGPTDPHAAHSGSRVLALGLDRDYTPQEKSWVRMPDIDVGAYSDVRLQYWRYLAVEDGFFDQARITVNDATAWKNRAGTGAETTSIHHIDREWRFHDVPVSEYADGHTLRIAWNLNSDEGLNLGGWALDDVCIVANPTSICGDGVQSPTEQCDEGSANADTPNACRTFCKSPTCGDHIVDDAEECDDGRTGSAECSAECKGVADAAAGCCSAADSGGPGVLLLGGWVAAHFRRRRYSRRRGPQRLAVGRNGWS
jgi:hypothetical protein